MYSLYLFILTCVFIWLADDTRSAVIDMEYFRRSSTKFQRFLVSEEYSNHFVLGLGSQICRLKQMCCTILCFVDLSSLLLSVSFSIQLLVQLLLFMVSWCYLSSISSFEFRLKQNLRDSVVSTYPRVWMKIWTIYSGYRKHTSVKKPMNSITYQLKLPYILKVSCLFFYTHEQIFSAINPYNCSFFLWDSLLEHVTYLFAWLIIQS